MVKWDDKIEINDWKERIGGFIRFNGKKQKVIAYVTHSKLKLSAKVELMFFPSKEGSSVERILEFKLYGGLLARYKRVVHSWYDMYEALSLIKKGMRKSRWNKTIIEK